MPSFAYEVKSELANVLNYKRCCDIAQLNAMLKVGAILNENKIEFNSNNAMVARKVLKLIKKIYQEAQTEVAVIRNKKFRFRNRYIIRIFKSVATESLFKEMQVNRFPVEVCCQNAYLRGLFLTCGSVNRPESSYYHIEISTNSEDIAKFIEKNIKKMGFPARSFERKNMFVVYFKEFDMICDFLYIIEAENAVERFEVAQNIKEVRANVSRLVNCETANLQNAINAAQRQLRDIRIIKATGQELDNKLNEVAEIRLKHPELNMRELAEKIFVSTSCVKQRMHKIHMIANPEEKNKPKKKKRGRKSKKEIQEALEQEIKNSETTISYSKSVKNSSNGRP